MNLAHFLDIFISQTLPFLGHRPQLIPSGDFSHATVASVCVYDR